MVEPINLVMHFIPPEQFKPVLPFELVQSVEIDCTIAQSFSTGSSTLNGQLDLNE